MPAAIERYTLARDEVRTRCPAAWQEVAELCGAVPGRIDAAAVWAHGRDKPSWSNIKVDVGRRIAADLGRSPDFRSAAVIAGDRWEIVMRERGPSWKKNANFDLRGVAVRDFVARLPTGGLRSFLWRLHATRNLALALQGDTVVRRMVDDLERRQGPLEPGEIEGWTRTFAGRVGMGWGHVTVNHMLTDLGLSVKPDIHVRRSIVKLGFLAPQVPSTLCDERIDSLAPRIDHEIVRILIGLAPHVAPTAHWQANRSLREIDKVLMEWSRQGLARPQ